MKVAIRVFFSCSLLLISFFIKAQQKLSGKVSMPDHPRLLLLKGEEEKIRQSLTDNPVWEKVHQGILAKCDGFITLPPVEHIKIGRRLLDKSRTCLERVFYLSYAWRMTHDEKYLKRAEKELLAVSAFNDWNPSHFLDVAEMTMAVAIGYDWLYNDLSKETRDLIKAAIINKGLNPSMETNETTFWLKAAHNWNQVCNAGLSFGAIAVYEDQPDFSNTVINRAISTVNLPMQVYEPDGGYPEGYGYWAYGTTFNVMMISAFQKAFGTEFGLADKPGFLKTAGFLLNMTGPTGQPFNFSDSGTMGELNPAMFWFASKLKDPSLLYNEQHYLNQPAKTFTDDRLLPAMLIWCSGIPLNAITAPKETMWLGKGINPLALMRSSWTDPNAIFVGMKGGSPGINHAHMDVGSFVMDADQIRWASDFGMQAYESLESKGVNLWNMKQNSQRWQVLRYNNMYHNTLTVNNEFQRVSGSAPIVSYSNDPMHMNAIMDISSVYDGQLAKAIRGIELVNKNYVVVQDELESNAQPALLRWSMLTTAAIKIISKNEAELSSKGKKLILRVQQPGNISIKTWSTTPTTDYDSPNPGTVIIGFETTLPANSTQTLQVLLIPQASLKKTIEKIKPLTTWKINP